MAVFFKYDEELGKFTSKRIENGKENIYNLIIHNGVNCMFVLMMLGNMMMRNTTSSILHIITNAKIYVESKRNSVMYLIKILSVQNSISIILVLR